MSLAALLGLLLFAGVGLASTLAHELGHYGAWRAMGYAPRGFEVHGLGSGTTTLPDDEAARVTDEAARRAIAAGPAAGSVVILVAMGACLGASSSRWLGARAIAAILLGLLLVAEAINGLTPWLDPGSDGGKLAQVGATWAAPVGVALSVAGAALAWRARLALHVWWRALT